MLLHDHPVNEARERRGEPPINAVWLWGGGRLAAPDRARRSSACAGRTRSPQDSRSASGARGRCRCPTTRARWLRGAGNEGVELIVLDALRAPAALRRRRHLDANGSRRSSATGSRRSPARCGRGASAWSRCTRSGRRARSTSRRRGRTCATSGDGRGRSPSYAMSASRIVTRRVPLAAEQALARAGVHPLLARLFASRGVKRGTRARLRPPHAHPARRAEERRRRRSAPRRPHRRRPAAHDRRRLRLRRRDRLRGRVARALGLRRERRLLRAQPLRDRLRPVARGRRSGRAGASRPPHHRRQRHRERRRRRARARSSASAR